jgi:Predicted membrane protein (DUF2306)
MRSVSWIIFAFFAISIGLYPIIYLLINANFGLLDSKPVELLESSLWNWAFYQHIFLGGIALLSGWSQFSTRFRTRNLSIHRLLGKIYVGTCILSGSAGLYLAFYATGGWVASLGFGGLALSWLFTTSNAFLSIRNKQIEKHQLWMIRSYALTFAAVTLRIYLPLSQIVQLDFIDAYRGIAWLCWVPNLLVAEWIIMNLTNSSLQKAK